MATSSTIDGDPSKDPAKTQDPLADRLGTMRARLRALPRQIVLHPSDLGANLELLESLQDNPPRLERAALSILEQGYR